jgi:para-aminobenzoate synthetase/4-amino-4-deoxychorismate lyase
MRFGEPFILLDDARPDGTARLYTDPVRILAAETTADVAAALDALRAARAEGLHAAGYVTYEVGAVLEPRAGGIDPPARPLLWFGLFRGYQALASAEVAALLPDPESAWAGTPRPCISRADYGAAFARVADYIAAGDIYQANLTFRADVPFAGNPAALYALLRDQSLSGHGALVHTGSNWLVSLSPELFFALDATGRLTARPMKGTAKRGATPAEDAVEIRALHEDPKQRAENLMILDLMRNDLSRVARAGSVRVPERFVVETYPTVHAMVSAVTAELAPDKDAIDAIETLFPCGSVTGAPKIRAMQVIAEVEHGPRHAYTGSIGHLDPDGSAAFNVAIRTLEIASGADRATLGLGSGVVADSNVDAEWEECLAKGKFVNAGRPFDLIETMAFDPEHGVRLLERHLARLGASALALDFAFDRHVVRNELQAATFRLRHAARIRLLLAPSGAISIGIAPMPEPRTTPLAVAVAPSQVAPDDFRLQHKTSRRGFHDDARRASGADEILFTDASGFLTEGSFTSIFVERDDVLLTPPISRGLLPGVLRAELLDAGRAVEADLTPKDLLGGFLLGNALRGLMPARIAQPALAPL